MEKQDIYTTIQQNKKDNAEVEETKDKDEITEEESQEPIPEEEPIEEPPKPISPFQIKLDEQLFTDVTLRDYLFGVYKTVKEDRDRMKGLYDKIFSGFSPEDQPEINFLAHVNTYQKMMSGNNDQLIEMFKIIEKIVSASAKAEAGAKESGGSVTPENFDENDDWKFIAMEGGKQ